MPIIINPDGQTARFDATERIRLAERWASPVLASAPHDGTQAVAVNDASAELSGRGRLHNVVDADYSSLEARTLTRIRMNGGPWPFHNTPLRGRTAKLVIVDELENYYPLQPVASRALVPVSALRQCPPVERFDKALLQEIDRPVYDTLLFERKRMREQWDRLMSEKAAYLYRTVQIRARPYLISEARWRGLPEHPLIDEVDRRLLMLVEDGTSYDDVRLFSLEHPLNVTTLPLMRGILVCYGPGARQHFIVKKPESNT